MSTPATPQTPSTGTNKADPDALALRASPRPVTRLNRRMLAVLAGALGIVILGATLWSLQPHKRERNPATELYNVDRVSRADSLDQLPKDYTKVVPMAKPGVPMLGEPLPGDLGPAIVHAQNQGNTGAYTPRNPAASHSRAMPRMRRVRRCSSAAVVQQRRHRQPPWPQSNPSRHRAIKPSIRWLRYRHNQPIRRLRRIGRSRSRPSSPMAAIRPPAIRPACNRQPRPTK